MAFYTYFIMTPGYELESYIQRKEGAMNFFKFGDTQQNTQLGIRNGYTTHNPDIGIFTVFTDQLQNNGRLGTYIKTKLIFNSISLLPGTEWFPVGSKFAWNLAAEMNNYRPYTVNDDNVDKLVSKILKALGK